MSDFLLMTRRSFMGSVLALAASPAIVRASSLMQVQSVDWTKYVREIVSYSIDKDCMMARWDILSPASGQYHVDIQLSYADWDGLQPVRDNLYVPERELALEVLGNELKQRNISPRSLIKLPLPEGVDWARHLG